MNKHNYQYFLDQLEALTRETGLVIAGNDGHYPTVILELSDNELKENYHYTTDADYYGLEWSNEPWPCKDFKQSKTQAKDSCLIRRLYKWR